VAVVTDCSSPLGSAIANELSRRGLQVAGLTALEPQPNPDAYATRYRSFPVDFSDEGAIVAAFASIKRQMGDVTILINNHSPEMSWDFLRGSPVRLVKLISDHITGIVCCLHAALTLMSSSGAGRVIHIMSAEQIDDPVGSIAAATGASMNALIKCLAADFGDRFPNIVITQWRPDPAPRITPNETAAGLIASLALWHDRTLHGMVFEGVEEIVEKRSLGARIKSALLLKPVTSARRLDGQNASTASSERAMP